MIPLQLPHKYEEYPPMSEDGVGNSAASTSFHDQQFTEVPRTAHEISKDESVWIGLVVLLLVSACYSVYYMSLVSKENQQMQNSRVILACSLGKSKIMHIVLNHSGATLDSWVQVCFVLTTGINSAYVLGYSDAVMVHLGWIAGVVGLIAATALSLYASTLVAKIHEVGETRHIRYRDLAGYIYGKKGFYTVWILQYLNLFMFNVGFIILGGSAIKDVYGLFSDENALKLSHCNLIAGLVCFLFAIIVPHLSALGAWLGLSAILSSIYIIVAIAVSIKDGSNSSVRDYSIPGTSVGKIFLTIGAISNLFVPFNSGMIPEIQATVRAPVVGNTVKALCVQFTIGELPIFAVMFCGYWAYGSSTSSYLLDNASGPVWAKALANIAAFLQSIVSFQIYACPSYEYLDTTFGPKTSGLRFQKLSLRVGLRGCYLAVSTVTAALLPFIGDFIGLIGSVCVLPLTVVIPHHLYMMAKNNKLSSLQKLWHWLNVIFFGALSVAATVESVRLIVIDSKDYKIFGD